jgi:hypothetical protein
MYEFMKESGLQKIYEGFLSYGIMGVITGIIKVFTDSQKFSFKRTIRIILSTSFVGCCVGGFLTSYTNMPLAAVFSACSLASYVSEDILKMIKTITKNYLPEILRKKLEQLFKVKLSKNGNDTTSLDANRSQGNKWN